MNSRTLIPTTLAAALTVTGCARKAPPLTETQKTQVAQEVSIRMKAFTAAIERADAAASLTFLSESPEFRWTDTDGKIYASAETRAHWRESLASIRHMKYPTAYEQVFVVAPDAVYHVSQCATSELVLKDGTALTRGTFTFGSLWRREGSTWKIAYCQEASLPPMPLTPAEAPPAKK